jgi:hypothetical protein
MDPKAKAKQEELKKAQRPDDEEEKNGTGEEGEEEEEKSCKKSEELSQDDLEKSLTELTNYAEANDGPTRKEVLLQKAMTEDLSKSENEELFQLMGPESNSEPDTLADEVSKALEPSDDLKKAMDVSGVLTELNGDLSKALNLVAENQTETSTRQHGFNLMLAKSVVRIGKAVQDLQKSVDTFGDQPVRAPKSRGVTASPLQKSFADAPPADPTRLTKSQVLDTISVMIEESMAKGQGGHWEGVDLLTASEKFEHGDLISKSLIQEVEKRNAGR